ncbi:uncharacterized protein LOC127689378 isoform X2 [Apodemus sylvaticus]|uniref:uncharacterized protein LOC127689378 isoform X2 n=1 Tax=Apodemus sylvaticus TaxID=10129 RepID=UPI0022432391|nr:uncharacterized protein LOC127689378 isoform X2 [Apodemus sylvaticus]
MKTKDIPEISDTTLAPNVNKSTSKTLESEEVRKHQRVSDLLKRIEQKQAMGPQYGVGMQAFSGASPETTVKKEKENSASSSVVEEKTSESMTKVEPRRFKNCTENVPDIKQIFCRDEEFEPHDEGSWEEYKSYFPGGVRVSESRHTMTSTMVGSYTAQAGDTDVEEQHQDLDSKESFPDVMEVQQWEQRKVSSTLSPAIDTLFVKTSTSSDDNHISIRRKRGRNGGGASTD